MSKQRVITAGTRGYVDYESMYYLLCDYLKPANSLSEHYKFVSGRCNNSPDMLPDYIRRQHDSELDIAFFPAKWKREDGTVDKGAGFKRNTQMANYADILVAFWDLESNGTRHMINQMMDRDKDVVIFPVRI